ncbi:MAG: carbohydrate kinase family protein [Clostridia bacterium]|nr:carbohydrate kinase family protein [Clostridia bacterium]
MQFDIYSFGMISSSTLHILADNFPGADCYSEIKDTYKMVGGEAANSSIVLSKLGLKVKLDGNWLGKNDEGIFTKQILDRFNIDTSRLTIKADYSGVQEIVFADSKTRTIFGTYVQLHDKEDWNTPSSEDIQNSKIVCLDPFFKEESLKTAQLCKSMNKPYVTIDCEYTSEIAKNAEVLIISGEFRGGKYAGCDHRELYLKYREHCNGLVIFTFGQDPILYSRKGEAVNKFEPYRVTAVDTAGAGDSFRSGILYGLLNGWSDSKTINFASALAAMVCTTFPGVLNAPGFQDVLQFIESNGRILE